MPFFGITNRAGSTLNADINNTVTALAVAAGQGGLFPAANFIATIEDERILVTTRTTDAFNPITRGYDGTTAVAHVAGVAVELRIVAAHLLEIETALSAANLKTTLGITTAGAAILDDANAAAQLATLGASPLAPTGATYTPATGAQTVTIDVSAGNMHVVTGHASGTAITFAITGATNNQPFIVSILQGAVVSTIAAWWATVRWAGGTAPTLTATVNKRDTFGFIRTGANTYDGFVVGQNA